MADGCPDSGDLARGNRGADSRSADEDAPLGLAVLDRGAELAGELVRAFLAARFDGGERYVRRLKKVEEMEKAHV